MTFSDSDWWAGQTYLYVALMALSLLKNTHRMAKTFNWKQKRVFGQHPLPRPLQWLCCHLCKRQGPGLERKVKPGMFQYTNI